VVCDDLLPELVLQDVEGAVRQARSRDVQSNWSYDQIGDLQSRRYSLLVGHDDLFRHTAALLVGAAA
jgi:hypothetical protein